MFEIPILKAGVDYNEEAHRLVKNLETKTRLFGQLLVWQTTWKKTSYLNYYSIFIFKKLKLEFSGCQVLCLRV